jgi:hypothetical protein
MGLFLVDDAVNIWDFDEGHNIEYLYLSFSMVYPLWTLARPLPLPGIAAVYDSIRGPPGCFTRGELVRGEE